MLPLESYIVRGGENECWGWTGPNHKDGARYRDAGAQRAYWISQYGPIRRGVLIKMRCGNKGCMNPSHMYAEAQY